MVKQFSTNLRRCHPEMFLKKAFLKICSKFKGEHPCRSVISIKLLCNFIEIALRHGCSPVNLLHISRTPFSRNTPGWLLLQFNFYFLLFKLFVVRISFNNARFSTGMAGWLLQIFQICLHNQLSSIHFIISTDVWKMWFIK